MRLYCLPVILLFFLGGSKASGQSATMLWYNRPATFFEESIVLGNGTMGASVFGGVATDSVYLNDATLWTGEPVNPAMNPTAYQYLPAVRQALQQQQYKQADSLNKFIQGSFSQAYAPLGTLYINHKHNSQPTQYRRQLNLANATASVSYQADGAAFTRTYFVSHPHNIMAIKITGNKKGAINCSIHFKSLLRYTVATATNRLQVNGYAAYKSQPNYRGDVKDAVLFDPLKGTRFANIIGIKNTEGKVTATDSTLEVSNATEATVYVSIATSFNGFDKNPVGQGRNALALAAANLDRAMGAPYTQLLASHVSDYQTFFNRVKLTLGDTTAPNVATNDRLIRYASGGQDKPLEILYFNFGRYLLISSSRTKGVPANLQGVWNQYLRPPWSSNYTTNINLEENYWPAEIANLPEMHEPLIDFIGHLATTGAVTAKTFYGVKQGWAACHNSDIWAMSNPVGDFGNGSPVWANWNMAGAWLSTHLWDHYLFTSNREYLQKTAYPLMKGAALFCLGWMVNDEKGNLVTSPSTSPENTFITPAGYNGQTTYGATADLAMIRECFLQTIRAASLLKVDKDFVEKMEDALQRMYPYQIGKKGNLQEWYFDWEDTDPKHRHQSHLYGLYPGRHINMLETPELAAACRKTLEIKGDETTGWSKGWRINLWARLHDGPRAYKMYRELLRYVPADKTTTNYSGGGGTYPNLLDAHPPFQIDGNFGGTAAVIEMLLQSTENEVVLLPALPNAWPNGSITGIRARGGYTVALYWKNGQLQKALLEPNNSGLVNLRYANKTKSIMVKKGLKTEVRF